MLTIRKAQMDAFQADQDARYEARLERFLRNELGPAVDESPAELRAFVAAQIPKADQYGLSTEQQTAVYVLTAYLLGPSFDVDAAEARRTLTSPTLEPDEKAQWLSEWSVATVARLTDT